MIGGGGAEAGPLAESWFSNVFTNLVIDGAVLLILHLNGAKIANPAILAYRSGGELADYFSGLGREPFFIRGSDPGGLNPIMVGKMDQTVEKIKFIQKEARLRTAVDAMMPKWSVLIACMPKGWTGLEKWDGEPIGGTFRAH